MTEKPSICSTRLFLRYVLWLRSERGISPNYEANMCENEIASCPKERYCHHVSTVLDPLLLRERSRSAANTARIRTRSQLSQGRRERWWRQRLRRVDHQAQCRRLQDGSDLRRAPSPSSVVVAHSRYWRLSRSVANTKRLPPAASNCYRGRPYGPVQHNYTISIRIRTRLDCNLIGKAHPFGLYLNKTTKHPSVCKTIRSSKIESAHCRSSSKTYECWGLVNTTLISLDVGFY